MARIGIDLGTSTSEIAVYRDGQPEPILDPKTKSPIVPSLVAINKRGEVVVGDDAKPYVDLPGQGIRELKRLMLNPDVRVTLGGNEYRPQELASIILRKLKSNAESALGEPVESVVLSVPANFPDIARTATREAGDLAGLNIVRMINEPTAAALAYGIQNPQAEEVVAVFDFGGGTLDITILEMFQRVVDVKVSHGDPVLGGKDFDAMLKDLILAKFRTAHPHARISQKSESMLSEKAEACKKSLSSQTIVADIMPNFAIDESGEPIDLIIEVTREEFEDAVRPLLERVRTTIADALRKASLLPSDITRVLLVGGTTYIPIVQKIVAECFGRLPAPSSLNPDLAVCLGAAVEAALLAGEVEEHHDITKTDVAPYGLGIAVLSEVGNQIMLIYDSLIAPNTSIPFSVSREYSLVHPDQRTVEVHLYQDHSGRAKFPHEAIDTGITGVIDEIPPAMYGSPHPFRIDFSYDLDGFAVIKASIPGLNKSVVIRHAPSSSRMTEREKTESMRKLDELWRSNPSHQTQVALLDRARRLRESCSPDDSRKLAEASDNLVAALRAEDPERIQEMTNRLVDIMFELEQR